MHSDNYEFARSSAPQSVKDYSAFTDKQWNTKPDTSSCVYQSQNSIVEFDIGIEHDSTQLQPNLPTLSVTLPIGALQLPPYVADCTVSVPQLSQPLTPPVVKSLLDESLTVNEPSPAN